MWNICTTFRRYVYIYIYIIYIQDIYSPMFQHRLIFIRIYTPKFLFQMSAWEKYVENVYLYRSYTCGFLWRCFVGNESIMSRAVFSERKIFVLLRSRPTFVRCSFDSSRRDGYYTRGTCEDRNWATNFGR